MKSFDGARLLKPLSLGAAVATFVLICVGGVVRVTGAGLGCPDWPLCYGQVLPPPDILAWIEFSHRLSAAVAGLFIAGSALAAWFYARGRPALRVPAITAALITALQIPLGGVVVLTETEPLIVGFHLITAMIIFAGLLLAAVAAWRGADRFSAPRLEILIGLFGLLLIFASGASVVGAQASLGCPDWPLCYGMLWPLGATKGAIQMLHRLSVGLASAAVIWIVLRALRDWSQVPGVLPWTAWLGGLFAMQAMVGAVQVLFSLPTLLRALHLAFAAGSWAALILLGGNLMLAGLSRSAGQGVDSSGEDRLSGAVALRG